MRVDWGTQAGIQVPVAVFCNILIDGLFGRDPGIQEALAW